MSNLVEFTTVTARARTLQEERNLETPSIALTCVFLVALGLPIDEVEDAITDQGNDRGIDALYIDDRNRTPIVHIVNTKFRNEISTPEPAFPANEIDKLLSFVSDLMGRHSGLKATTNPVLWDKVTEIWKLFDLGQIPDFQIHIVGNRGKLIPAEQARLKQSLAPYRQVEVNHWDTGELASLLRSQRRPNVNGQLRLVEKDYFERSDGDIRGLIATTTAGELAELVRNPEAPGETRLEIFDENARGFLGPTNRINKRIFESAVSEEAPYFWYKNNGVTIICERFAYLPQSRSPIVKLENFQVVNGGQTSNSLFQASIDHPGVENDVLVLVRIYETRREDLALQIAESTNSQTPINTRDLRSNDEIQRTIEIALESKGYFYERKASQFPDTPRDRTIDALEAGQAYVAFHLSLPEVARKDRSRVFGNLYDTIFREDLDPLDLVIPTLLFREIVRLKRALLALIRRQEAVPTRDLFILDGGYHVLFVTSYLAALRGVDKQSLEALRELIPSAIDFIADEVDEQRSTDAAFSASKFFKDRLTKDRLERRIST